MNEGELLSHRAPWDHIMQGLVGHSEDFGFYSDKEP